MWSVKQKYRMCHLRFYLFSSWPPPSPPPPPPVGQQPSGRPEEEKPLSELQRASLTCFHGFSFSSVPSAGRNEPDRRLRSRPLSADLCPLQPGLLVHLPGQGHPANGQVNNLFSFRLKQLCAKVRIHPRWQMMKRFCVKQECHFVYTYYYLKLFSKT